MVGQSTSWNLRISTVSNKNKYSWVRGYTLYYWWWNEILVLYKKASVKQTNQQNYNIA